ncbi:MAG TPA: tRNA pseudouridine(38-40) synthase TruA [Candidatus Omnitrophota bacterium]|nr:tRNA pseudouridine(38-40) synthase TruA [Candidatus Omnitrophota bacterium]
MTPPVDAKMKNIKLVLEYDGTRFFGFQKQKKGRTIQSELEKALRRIFRKRISVIPAGRTDSGVHARGQVVNFRVDTDIPLENIRRALNTYLPEEIAVREIALAAPDFHARYSAKGKLYRYRLLLGKTPGPLERFYSCHYPYPLDIPRMKKAAGILEGRHDFRAFQAHADGEKNSVRTLYRLAIREKPPFLEFSFEGDGFLYNMVRNIVGTLLWVGNGKMTLRRLREVLKSKDRRLAGPTAPPQGLVLEKVFFE